MRYAIAATVALLLFATFPAISFATDEWWSLGWHYRVRAEVNASDYDRSDWIMEQRVDFSQLLGSLAEGKRLDPNSIRVVEYEGGQAKGEAVSQFDRDSPDSWGGELVWRIDGDLPRNNNRTYYVYFDTLENGEKAAPGYESGVIVQSRDRDIRLDSSKLMIYMDRTQYGYAHVAKKAYDWQNMVSPDLSNPLQQSRENVSRYHGMLSLFGDHFCDPGCEWGLSDNLEDQVINQGPLRATVRSTSVALERNSDNSTMNFTTIRTVNMYAGKPFYRMQKLMRFDQVPLNVSGMNRRMWILQGRAMAFAYEPRAGDVVEGPFPTGGQEYSDWNGTWDDALGSDNEGIADFEMLPVPEPRSLWIEKDPNGAVSYISALWRPESYVSTPEESEFIYYFHTGDWRQADIPMRYRELRNPPLLELGNISDFALRLRIPPYVLNWDPTVDIGREVDSPANITIERMDCKMQSEERGTTLFEGQVDAGGISVFDVPEGRWKITCVAFDQHGHASTDAKETMVYDVLTFLKVCGVAALLLIAFAGLMLYRITRGARRKGRALDCPRCGMPLEEGVKGCPVCGKKLK